MNARTIPSFPDYQANERGEIIRFIPDRRSHALTGKPLVATPNHAGYPELTLCRDGQAHNARVNRVVCEAFHGQAPAALHHAAHLNGDRSDNRPANLAWKLPDANEADKIAHGTKLRGDRHPSRLRPDRLRRGETHGRAKLTAEAVRSIRSDSRSQSAIAAHHGVSQKAVQMVLSGKTWGHVA